MSYEEKYGEIILSDYEQEEIQQRIDDREKLERLEKCVEAIKDLLIQKVETMEEMKDLISEIDYQIKCLD